MKKINYLLFFGALAFIFMSAQKVDANTTEVTFKNYVSSLNKDTYVLYVPSTGGFITNKNGDNNFSKKQLEDTAGEIITVDSLKDVVNNNTKSNIRPVLRGTGQPTRGIALRAGQSYTSQAFGGSGWRYGGFWIAPDFGTGGYLLWTSYGDSALVGPQHQVSNHTGTVLNPGQPRYVVSDINRGTSFWGVCYLTYNPANGSYYTVYNG